MNSTIRTLYIVVCGAGPASEVGSLVALAQASGWEVQLIATPAAIGFLDVKALEAQTGRPVKSSYRKPTTPRGPRLTPAAIIVAPATFNTINKLAAGISDTYALGFLAEQIGTDIPIVVLPFINAALAARIPLRNAIETLRAEGIDVLLGTSGYEPHPPGSGNSNISPFPWLAALERVDSETSRHTTRSRHFK
ncbi:flavoprotein [Pilimelia anulata]|uniref:Flavoprotein n=1 Tax=Pilimelia anulata TaxID=53371 RepID=A0A8J3F747_9ACTN|nr:flavoprotein [Pilimelia anulata]GGJ75266.1 flavoprotein [Pilimelia anulata]